MGVNPWQPRVGVNPWQPRDYEKIGTEGLEGRVFLDTITIRGPCGEGHTMSLNAAAQLRDWLDSKLGGPVTIDAEVEYIPARLSHVKHRSATNQ